MTSSVLRSALNVLQPRNIPNTPASPPSPTSPGIASPRSRHHSRRSNAENVDFAKGLAPLPPTRSPPATAAKSTPTINSNDDVEVVLQGSSIINNGEIKDEIEEVVLPSQQQPEWSGGVEAEDLGRRLELLSQVDEEDPADLEGLSSKSTRRHCICVSNAYTCFTLHSSTSLHASFFVARLYSFARLAPRPTPRTHHDAHQHQDYGGRRHAYQQQ